jgi:hypothetical protein
MSRLNSQVRFMDGLRESDAHIELGGLRESDARIELEGLREEDARIRLAGLRESDAHIALEGLKEDDAGIRLEGLRESDAKIELEGCYFGEALTDSLGRVSVRQIRNPVLYRKVFKEYRHDARDWARSRGQGHTGYSRMFHPAVIEGTGGQMGDIFDIFRALPSAEEYTGKIKVIMAKWAALRPRFMKLSSQSRAAIQLNMTEGAKTSVRELDETMPRYLREGIAMIDSGRWRVVRRIDAYMPTLETLVAQAEALGPAPTVKEETQRTNETATQDVTQREIDAGKSTIEKALPYVGAAAGVGVIVAIIAALA